MEHKHKCECGRPGIFLSSRSNIWRCAKSSNSCPAVKAKKRQSLLDLYGVENVSQIEGMQDRKKKIWMEKYGVDNPSKAQINIDKIKDAWPDIERKRKDTMLEKYGVDSYSKTTEFQDRRKETWIKNYGVDNPAKNVDILHKIVTSNAKSEYWTKLMTLPSGKECRYQGYENQVILELIKMGLSEDEIITGPGNVPHIKYTFEGKEHRYYPDIYIPKFNKIIEVKSLWTWKRYKEKNLAKRQACIDAGFNVNIIFRGRMK